MTKVRFRHSLLGPEMNLLYSLAQLRQLGILLLLSYKIWLINVLLCYVIGFMAGKIFMSMVVARFSIEIAFSLVYIYSAELFPTTLR